MLPEMWTSVLANNVLSVDLVLQVFVFEVYSLFSGTVFLLARRKDVGLDLSELGD